MMSVELMRDWLPVMPEPWASQIRNALRSFDHPSIDSDPDLAKDRTALAFRMQTFDLDAAFKAARTAAIDSGRKVALHMSEAVSAHLAERLAPARAEPEKPREVPAAASRPIGKVSGAITIKREEVTRGGRSVKVGPRAALLIAVLDRAKPNCVGDEFLIGKIWTQRPANAAELLDQLIVGLAPLKQIGLEVRTHRGVGRQLVEV